MNVYIDTNIFLMFYHLTKDDLDELRKLAVLIRDRKITLLLPDQTRNEFVRNRDKSIADAIDTLQDQKITNRFPQIAKAYNVYQPLLDAIKSFERHKNKIITSIQTDAKGSALNADEVVTLIFNSATKIPTTDDLLEKAKTRFDLGNPPGKGRSYGDALNWECLLETVPVGNDLHLISDDADYTSNLDRSSLNTFLKEEWDRIQKSCLFYYKSLSEFLKEHFEEIELSDQFEKEMAIDRLANARSFASAKSRLRNLSKYSEFTEQQLNDIVEVATTNSQIYWISTDSGVGDRLIKIIEGKEDQVQDELLNRFNKIFRPEKYDDSDDLPF